MSLYHTPLLQEYPIRLRKAFTGIMMPYLGRLTVLSRFATDVECASNTAIVFRSCSLYRRAS